MTFEWNTPPSPQRLNKQRALRDMFNTALRRLQEARTLDAEDCYLRAFSAANLAMSAVLATGGVPPKTDPPTSVHEQVAIVAPQLSECVRSIARTPPRTITARDANLMVEEVQNFIVAAKLVCGVLSPREGSAR